MRAMILVLLVGCVVDDVGQAEQLSTGGEDGFGFACEHVYSPTQLHTDCYSHDGERGICAFRGICRRRCDGTSEDTFTCPAGYVPHGTIGADENGIPNCHCEPVRCHDDTGVLACWPPMLAP
jgi:hypothetical protein